MQSSGSREHEAAVQERSSSRVAALAFLAFGF